MLMLQKYYWPVFAEQCLMNNKDIHVVGRGKKAVGSVVNLLILVL